MKTSLRQLTAAVSLLIPGLVAAEAAPGDWLNKMSSAVQTTNYEGTVVRIRNDNVEALKVAHVVTDGVIRERVVMQEGNGLEIIRNGNEVHCILPDKKQVLVEEWNDQSTLFSALPSSDIRFGSEYDVSIVRNDLIAGRKTILLAIRPHDEYRFGHRLWLDTETGFPLQTKLISNNGETIEQVKFADIRISNDIHASSLAPTVSTENFRWLTTPKRSISHVVNTAWRSTDLPPGFRAVSTHEEDLPGSDVPVVHLLYSDGLANVSVFVEPAKRSVPSGRSKVGVSNSFSTQIGDYQVTAVGEVPAQTVEKIASSMRPSQ